MKQLPVFSAALQIPEFDGPAALRAAVADAVPTLGRLSAAPAPGAAARRSGARPDAAPGFSMSGFSMSGFG